MSHIYFDISALTEPQWSGIARLTAELVRAFLDLDRVTFFYRDFVIDKATIEKILYSGSSLGLLILVRHRPDRFARLRQDLSDEASVGIYTNLKCDNRKYAQIIMFAHDISFVLTPELHDHAKTAGYRELFYENLQCADKIITISKATKRDLIVYFQTPEQRVVVALPGCRPVDAPVVSPARDGKPFFLILGTMEPRKNIKFLLEFLRHNKKVLEIYDFLFVGKSGWGPTWQELLERSGLKHSAVKYKGFVTDEERDRMLAECEALIFPSLFEGFGLPVLEALARGKIVLGSRSSGIVEAAGGHLIDFDPTNLASFRAAFDRFARLSEAERLEMSRAGCIYAKQQTWGKFADAVLGCIAPPLAGAVSD